MASGEIQVSNPATLSKIESFLNDPTYKETIENSANYNTRLCIERRMRMPFLDSQTGVAQNHSNLFMSARQRLPGLVEGQIYSYPSKRWRKKRRQYLMTFMQPRRKELDSSELDHLHTISTVENPAAHINEDSKDSMHLKDETAKDAWYYDELDMQDVEGFDDPDPDSDYDYEESYSKRKRRRGGKVSRGGGRGRKKTTNYDVLTDAEKPFSCELCGARYKTRPGLTYHYTHSHKDRDDEEDDSSSANNSSSIASSSGGGGSSTVVAAPSPKPMRESPATTSAIGMNNVGIMASNTNNGNTVNNNEPSGLATPGSSRRGRQPASQQTPTLTQLVSSEDPTSPDKKIPVGLPGLLAVPPAPQQLSNLVEGGGGVERERANPSPYCDFCLGDAQENKKTGVSEELVSCSDCGRSGHPSCLQFTDNMIISVRKYRWQCIECKCCSICGNSDNDDQLLFCDDCDRGYHMYCLSPPLATPPEGSWSCLLCLDQFHKK